MTLKKAIALGLALLPLLALPGCGRPSMQKYQSSFTGSFDTVVSIIAYAESQRDFDAFADGVQARMAELHRLFDIYNNYDGLSNAKTVNDQAGIAPVVVAPELLSLALIYQSGYEQSQGAVNMALGPVLRIWHDYRARYQDGVGDGALPPMADLQAASALTDIRDVVVDEAASTVFLRKKGMSLDLGAIAKGYATQLVADELGGGKVQNFLLDSGGNIAARGTPQDGRGRWGIGIQDPNANPLLPAASPIETLFVKDCAVVTSGDYQRFYTVGNRRIGHIIDPWTLMPAERFRSVTVIAPQSGEADLLSTALFVLPYDLGRTLIESLGDGYGAYWYFPDDHTEATDNLAKQLKRNGATNEG